MHVLFIPSWFESPGHPTSGKAIKDLAIALTQNGVKVNILFQSSHPFNSKTDLIQGISLYHVRNYFGLKSFPVFRNISAYLYLKIFKQYISDHGLPDIIHLHGYQGLAFATHIKNKFKLPFVYTEHSSSVALHKLHGFGRSFLRQYSLDANSIIAVSNYLRTELKKYTSRVDYVIPNCIDFSFFKPADKLKEKKIMMINLLTKNKQVDLGIHVFEHFLKANPEYALHIIGNGPEKGSLRKLIDAYNLHSKVFLRGEQKSEEWIDDLRSSSCLWLLSKSETFGVVVVEALACGIPVVCLDNKGVRDIAQVLEGNPMLNVLPSDSSLEAMNKEMENIILTRNPLDAIECRNRMKAKFGFNEVANRYITIYKEISRA